MSGADGSVSERDRQHETAMPSREFADVRSKRGFLSFRNDAAERRFICGYVERGHRKKKKVSAASSERQNNCRKYNLIIYLHERDDHMSIAWQISFPEFHIPGASTWKVPL